MHAKFQVAGFQNKIVTRQRSLDFVCLFLLGNLLVQVTWRFIAFDGSKIQVSVEDLFFKTSTSDFTFHCRIALRTRNI